MKYRIEKGTCPEIGCEEWTMIQSDGDRSVAEVTILPGHGANIRRYAVDGIEYLYPAPEPLVDRRHFGVPVLYPFPGIVRGCGFEFDGRRFELKPNRGTFYRHGYVIEEPFASAEPVVTPNGVSASFTYTLQPGNPLFTEFPIENRLTLTITLSDRRLQVGVEIADLDPENRLPFGFGLHPYFNLHGPRDTIQIRVPMKLRVDPDRGTLADPALGTYDLRSERTIEDMVIDDVFQGMTPDQPMTLTYGAIGKRLTISAGEPFTHSVVYSPEGAPYICLESWTCSHDAHRLYADGKQDAAHLIILPPGETIRAAVEYRVDPV